MEISKLKKQKNERLSNNYKNQSKIREFFNMPPIFNSGTEKPIHPALQILNFFNLEEVVNSLNITSPMQFLLDRNDKIAIGSSKIFYLDPYTLRNFQDSQKYCTNLNMTIPRK